MNGKTATRKTERCSRGGARSLGLLALLLVALPAWAVVHDEVWQPVETPRHVDYDLIGFDRTDNAWFVSNERELILQLDTSGSWHIIEGMGGGAFELLEPRADGALVLSGEGGRLYLRDEAEGEWRWAGLGDNRVTIGALASAYEGASPLNASDRASRHLRTVLAGERLIDGAARPLLLIRDGDGEGWLDRSSACPEPIQDLFWVEGAQGRANSRGLLFAVSDRSILVSRDGGESFDYAYSSSRTNGPALKAIHFITPERGVAIGEEGLVLLTEDGGESWQREQPFTGDTLNDVLFISPSIGYIVSDYRSGAYNLWRTEDGGMSWQGVTTNRWVSLHDIALHGRRLWVVGEQGTVLTSVSYGPERYRRNYYAGNLSRYGYPARFGYGLNPWYDPYYPGYWDVYRRWDGGSVGEDPGEDDPVIPENPDRSLTAEKPDPEPAPVYPPPDKSLIDEPGEDPVPYEPPPNFIPMPKPVPLPARKVPAPLVPAKEHEPAGDEEEHPRETAPVYTPVTQPDPPQQRRKPPKYTPPPRREPPKPQPTPTYEPPPPPPKPRYEPPPKASPPPKKQEPPPKKKSSNSSQRQK